MKEKRKEIGEREKLRGMEDIDSLIVEGKELFDLLSDKQTLFEFHAAVNAVELGTLRHVARQVLSFFLECFPLSHPLSLSPCLILSSYSGLNHNRQATPMG